MSLAIFERYDIIMKINMIELLDKNQQMSSILHEPI